MTTNTTNHDAHNTCNCGNHSCHQSEHQCEHHCYNPRQPLATISARTNPFSGTAISIKGTFSPTALEQCFPNNIDAQTKFFNTICAAIDSATDQLQTPTPNTTTTSDSLTPQLLSGDISDLLTALNFDCALLSRRLNTLKLLATITNTQALPLADLQRMITLSAEIENLIDTKFELLTDTLKNFLHDTGIDFADIELTNN